MKYLSSLMYNKIYKSIKVYFIHINMYQEHTQFKEHIQLNIPLSNVI